MNLSQANVAILAGAFRTLLAGVLGWVVSKGYLTSDLLNTLLLGAGTLGLCAWSIVSKQGDAAQLYSSILGAGRNILTVALTYAAGKGWIATDQVAGMVAAAGTITVALWSSESKYLTLKRTAPVMLACLLFPLAMMGCASLGLGNDPQQVVYNVGEGFLGPLSTLDTLSAGGLVRIPTKACAALDAVSTSFSAAETTVRDPNFQNGTTYQQIITALDNAAAAAVAIIAELALSAHQPMNQHAVAPPSGDPTGGDWTTLNSAISSDVAAIKCM